ncbi:hypothetical protein ACLOJK_021976 [Asimina triloba]
MPVAERDIANVCETRRCQQRPVLMNCIRFKGGQPNCGNPAKSCFNASSSVHLYGVLPSTVSASGLPPYIVSNCDSIEVMVDSHKFLGDTPDAVHQVLRARLDLDGGDYNPKYTLNAIKEGKAREADVDNALKNLYSKPIDAYAKYTNVNFIRGCDVVQCPNTDGFENAVAMSQISDATIIHMGLDQSVEAEGRDRTDLLLPGFQTQLINQIVDAANPHHPIILVLFSAGPLDISFAKDNPKMLDILVRMVVMPSLMLSSENIVPIPMTSIQLRPDYANKYSGRTYKFFDGPVVYPFGYGLSYTTFEYQLLSCDIGKVVQLDSLQHCHPLNYVSNSEAPDCPAALVADLECDSNIDFELGVRNTGLVDGSDVVIVYSTAPQGILDAPKKLVIGFKRVFVGAGSSARSRFSFDIND